MATETLQLPFKGRSRFSKALPVPPPTPPDSDTQQPAEMKFFPGTFSSSSPWGGALSRTSSKKEAKVVSKLSVSPRPQASLPLSPAAQAGGRLAVAVPKRRPVASPSPLILSPATLSPAALDEVEAAEPSSPASISDLLSAYSYIYSDSPGAPKAGWLDDNNERTMKYDGISAAPEAVVPEAEEARPAVEREDSFMVPLSLSAAEMGDDVQPSHTSPEDHGITTIRQQDAEPQPHPLPLETPPQSRPHTPSKEEASHTTQDPRVPLFCIPASPLSLKNPSPPIWRRRSVKSDKTLELTDLKVTDARTAPELRRPHLPGRNIRPIASRQVEDEEDDTMRSLKSKIKRIAGKASQDENDEKSSQQQGPATSSTAPQAKAAYPGYSTPGKASGAADSQETIKPPSSTYTAVRIPAPGAENIQPATAAATMSATQEVTAKDDSSSQGAFPERTTSRTAPQNAPFPHAFLLNERPVPQPPPVFPGRRTPLRRGGDRANRARATPPAASQFDLKEERPEVAAAEGASSSAASAPEIRASMFPPDFGGNFPPGTIFTPKTLGDHHFNCYTAHRHMSMDENRHYPLACQVCLVKDSEERFKCSWCNLRICRSCMEQLSSTRRRDLARLVERVGRGPGNLSEPTVQQVKETMPLEA